MINPFVFTQARTDKPFSGCALKLREGILYERSIRNKYTMPTPKTETMNNPAVLKPALPLHNTIVMSVDVEDYFMSPESIRFEDWPRFESSIHIGMERCLNLFQKYEISATFFFVGWLVERYPEIAQWAAEHGHEIGTHTFTHTFVTQLDEPAFDASIKKSLDVLHAAVPNAEIIGHRAPAFSLERHKTWQFEVLKRYGIRYDSSITPHATYLYGEQNAPRHPYRHEGLIEMPPAVIEAFGKRMPVGGGGTLRILPTPYLRWARKRYLNEGFPPVIYMHPWEFVPEHPKLDLPLKQRLIHWWGINSVERKLRNIFEHHRVINMRQYYEALTHISEQETS